MRNICFSFCLIAFLIYGPGAFGQKKVPIPKVPEGFEVSIFAQPPEVNYPVCVTAAPTGELFVGIDPQGSLGKKPDQGKIFRCIDTDGDGKADKINLFAKVDHPRGLIYDHGKLWVLHPPKLTLFQDENLDGKADRSETLVTGITTDLLKRRGADHTTNGIRMGIDGWIYIAVGDFGFVNAQGTDGKKLTLKGGGIVRVRPDGKEMEIYCRGLRNILDVSIDPQLNMFTRDNTNDGGGWDIRLSHILESAHYGYPSLFKNFADEIMPPLADYGGGSGCGSMFLSEPWFPKPYNRALLTCDWGRNIVFYHPLTPLGPTYKAEQEVFASLPRPTDIDVDGSGRLYISSWHGGKFNYAGEYIGYVAQVKPKGLKPQPFPNLSKLSDSELLKELTSESHVRRFHTQREILRRGEKPIFSEGLIKIIQSPNSLDARVAAVFTFKQLYGEKVNSALTEQLSYGELVPFILRALTDRKSQLDNVEGHLFTKFLHNNENQPAVRVAALIGIGRLGKKELAKEVLPFAVHPGTKRESATPTFRSKVIKKKRQVAIKANIKGAKKLFLVVTDAGNGIGNDHAVWLEPRLVGSNKSKKLTELKWTNAKAGWGGVHINASCRNRPIRVKGKPADYGIGTHAHSVIEYDLPEGFTTFEAKGTLEDGSGGNGSVQFLVFTDKLPETFRTGGKTQTVDPDRVIPHLAVKTLVRLNAIEACLTAIQGPHADGALRALRHMHDPKAVEGLIKKYQQTRNVRLRQGILTTLIRLYHKEGEYTGTWWGTRPDTSGPYYHRTKWQESPRIAKFLNQALTSSAGSETVEVVLNELTRHHVQIQLPGNLVQQAKKRDERIPDIKVSVPKFDPNNPKQIGNIPFEKIFSQGEKIKGDVSLGKKLFTQQSCIACHSVAPGRAPLGPQLMDIGKRYNRKQLLESIVKPSATIAQGFDTNVFLLNSGKVVNGFVVREAAEEIEVRTSEGKSILLAKNEIDERAESKQSVMPEGLVNNLTVQELASLVAYLESLETE